MEFLTILITLALLQLWGSGGPIQRDEWFQSIIDAGKEWVDSSRLRLFWVVVGPCIVLFLFLVLVDSIFFGLFSIIAYVGVLLYCLGREEFSENVQRYLSAWNNGDLIEAERYAVKIGDFQQLRSGEGSRSSVNVNARTSTDNSSEDAIQADSENVSELDKDDVKKYIVLHGCTRSALVYEGYERWFAVIFWFLVFGPIGALAYRLSYIYARSESLAESDREMALRVVHYLDWVPGRLLALAFSITGNFVNSFEYCWQAMWDDQPITELIEKTALAAISGTDENTKYPNEIDSFTIIARKEILALQSLLSRSVVCWVAVIALLELFV